MLIQEGGGTSALIDRAETFLSQQNFASAAAAYDDALAIFRDCEEPARVRALVGRVAGRPMDRTMMLPRCSRMRTPLAVQLSHCARRGPGNLCTSGAVSAWRCWRWDGWRRGSSKISIYPGVATRIS